MRPSASTTATRLALRRHAFWRCGRCFHFWERTSRVARIGVNALYLIPGGVGGTEIYLRELLAALARIDTANEYFVFTNLETGAELVPRQANFHFKPQKVRASFRPARILWEQIALPLEASQCRLDVMFNPGFTAPV